MVTGISMEPFGAATSQSNVAFAAPLREHREIAAVVAAARMSNAGEQIEPGTPGTRR
jgi:hypothetical protein